jgi:hypothetical protein
MSRSRKHTARGVAYLASRLTPKPGRGAGAHLDFPTDHTTHVIHSHSLTYHTRKQLNEALGFAKGPRKINRSGKARLIRQVVKGHEKME